MATRGMELQSIRDRLLISTGADSLAADIDDIRRFVTKKLNDITGLHHQDVSEAREWLSEYVGKIIMTPNGNHYIASGKWEWDLLGG